MRNSRRILVVVAAALVVLLLAIALQTYRRRRGEHLRMMQYQALVRQYSNWLQPGTPRRDVMLFLRLHKLATSQMCCVSTNHRGWSELVKIGTETAPWYCSERNIYIGFEFDPAAPQETPTNDDEDRLTDVTLFPWLEGCL
jgi:hypothetical protein